MRRGRDRATAPVGDWFEFITPDELLPAVMSQLARAVITVLAPTITGLWIDPVTDGTWAPHQVGDVERLRAISRARRGVSKPRFTPPVSDLDPTDPEHVRLFARLAPWSIGSEAWAGDTEVHSCSDTGDHLWCRLTGPQTHAVAAQLASSGLDFERVLVASKRR